MLVISETVAASLLSPADAIAAVEQAFAALSQGRATVYPVVQCPIGTEGARFGVKSGLLATASGLLAGPKVGGYWPKNEERGLPNHTSTVLLLDADTGLPAALVGASHLTALRTAAADAVAVKHLAHEGSIDVAVLGAGHQAFFDVLAISEVRAIRQVRIWSRSTERADALSRKLQDRGFSAFSSSAEAAVRGADVIVTATTARSALFEREWVKPGAHVSAMGADAPGKQELPIPLVLTARLFADSLTQAVTIGEFEAAARAEPGLETRITALGDVITGVAPGRTDPEEITIFDSSGVAIQDLAVCGLAFERARLEGKGVDVAW